MASVKVAVLGASGYIGGEVVRLLLQHPQVELACITAKIGRAHV
jgi:N-acetyl-gamma-glutamyl-phosphate reductase